MKETNKLIAEFMGNKTIRINVPFEYDLGEELPTSKNICNSIVDAMEEVQTEIDEGIINGCDLCMETPQYHTSWDWLMPVVDKIDLILTDDNFVTISFNRCLIEWFEKGITFEGLGNTKIEATYKAVVEFIKYYNDQNK